MPLLRELRRLAGVSEPPLSPALEVEALLYAGRLPEEDHCVLCGAVTDHCVYCRTECERATVTASAMPIWARMLGGFLSGITFGWYVFMGDEREETVCGQDRIYALPLRVCKECAQALMSPDSLRDALGRVHLYERLLKKYPQAILSLLGD
ncbi:MAG: hypothetical protein L0Y72_27020 [Gemmataceae bacterium]|nr:hypothetical protein [Gemmataceae bacterium]MCI0742703.1 hypothetical protein [Gemmataceae bacterium]